MGKRRKQRGKARRVGVATTRLVDPGPDEGGRWSPSPYRLQHGHEVEVAPQQLRTSKDSSFPKRIATQRMIDRYHRHQLITHAQWKAADTLWQLWDAAGFNPRIIGGYAEYVSKSAQHEGQLSHRIEAADRYLIAMRRVPLRAKGCVTHVVITDAPASDWARIRGYNQRESKRRGLHRLRQGLTALATHFGY